MQHPLLSFISLLLTGTVPLFAQHPGIPSFPKRYNQTALEVGLGYFRMQDRATSPLIYNGPGISVGGGQHFITARSETRVHILAGAATQVSDAPEMRLNTAHNAYFLIGQLSAQHLRVIPAFKNNRWQLWTGAKAAVLGDLRINNSLMNHALGFELFGNLFGSAKVQYNLPRPSRKERYPLLWQFFAQTHIGILNFNYRPGYNYLSSKATIGTQSSKAPSDPATSYALSLNGFRAQFEIGVIRSKFAGFQGQLSYAWDGLYAPGRYEAFGLVTHTIKYTLLLNKLRK